MIGTDWIGPTATKSFSGSKLSVFQTAGPAVTVPLEPRYSDNSFEMQLHNFAAAIRGEVPAINNAEQAFELMEMIDGIYASSELGREVPIP